jgi:hypothetical protein
MTRTRIIILGAIATGAGACCGALIAVVIWAAT